MKSVGIRQLQQHASAVIREVKAGEIIEITERGRPVARIVPATPMSRWDQMIADGRLIPPKQSMAESLRKFPPTPLAPGQISMSEALRQLREHER